MTVIASVVGVALLTGLLRLVPGLIWPTRDMDAGAHLMLRRQIRRHRLRLTMQDWPLVLDRRHTYPWLFHWLIALFPERWLRRVPSLTSALTDAAHAGLVTLLAAHLAPLAGARHDPAVTGLVAGLLFGTAPALLVVGFGPRAYVITPRPFGELAYTALMSAALLHTAGGQGWAGILVVLLGAVLLLSSKFAAQALLFCSPVMALLAHDARLLLLFPLAVAAALVLSGGAYWWVARTQVIHLRYYWKRLQYEHPVLATRNRGRELAAYLVRVLRRDADRRSFTEMIRLAEGDAILQFLLRNVLWCGVVALILAGLFTPWTAAGAAWHRGLLAWAIAPLAPFLLTSLRHFRFLGEAERYPEYGLAPVAILGATGWLGLAPQARAAALMLYAIACLPALAYTVARLRRNHRRAGDPDLAALITFLQSQAPGTVTLSLPWQLAFQVMPDVELRYVAALDATAWCLEPDRVFRRYPWVQPDFRRWRRETGLGLVIVDRRAMAAADAVAYDLSAFPVLFHSARYAVYDVGPPD